MILVYNIGAKLLFGDKEKERAATHIVVQADKPNVMMAMDIAKEIAQENILGDYNVPLAFVGHYVQVYPLDGGCGIALKDYLKSNDEDTIYNWDDAQDMKFNLEDLEDNALYIAKKDIESTYGDFVPWLEECMDSFKSIAKHIGAKLDYHQRDWDGTISIELAYDNDDIENLSGGRAIAWLENNITFKEMKRFQNGKRIHKGTALAKGNYEEIYLTGYCDDYCLHSAYKKFKNGMRQHKENSWQKCDEIRDFLRYLEEEMEESYNGEIEYIGTDEWINEMVECHNLYFDMDGNIID